MKLFKNIGSNVGIIVGIIPTLNSPPIYPFCCSTMSLIRPASFTILLACTTIFSPISVNEMGFLLLSKIKISSSSSNFWICMLKVG